MDIKKVSKKYICECLREFDEMRQKPGKGEDNGCLQAALFVEDMFGIVLADEEISAENLKGYKNLEAFVLKKCGL